MMPRARRVAIALVLGAMLPGAAQSQTAPAAEVVAAEAAFAARVRESGVRAGFLEYLAPDGVVFRPGPVNAREFFTGRPASSGLLSWRPAVADVSAAGDVGYSTGPYEARPSPSAPVAGRGWYLSIWRRQPDGSLRLLVDHGMASSSPPDSAGPVQLWPASQPGRGPAPDMKALDTAGEPAVAHERVRTLARGALHVGPTARSQLFGAAPPRLTPLAAGSAVSGDLGYTYGSYDWANEHGYYVRVWRLAGSRWLVVAEVFSPVQ